MTIPASLRSQLRAAASQVDRCEADLRRRCDAHNVHAMRVALQRGRAVLWSMKPWIRRAPYRFCRKSMKAMSRELGPLRDLDVLGLGRLLPQMADTARVSEAGLRGMATEIRRQRLKLRRRARAAMRTVSHARRVRQLGELLADPRLFRKSACATSALWRDRILQGVEDFDRKSLEAGKKDLHCIRLLAKRCRYTLELPGADAPKRVRQRMKALQTSLGSCCDAQFAVSWLKRRESLQDQLLREQLLRTARKLARQRAVTALRELRQRSD